MRHLILSVLIFFILSDIQSYGQFPSGAPSAPSAPSPAGGRYSPSRSNPGRSNRTQGRRSPYTSTPKPGVPNRGYRTNQQNRNQNRPTPYSNYSRNLQRNSSTRRQYVNPLYSGQNNRPTVQNPVTGSYVPRSMIKPQQLPKMHTQYQTPSVSIRNQAGAIKNKSAVLNNLRRKRDLNSLKDAITVMEQLGPKDTFNKAYRQDVLNVAMKQISTGIESPIPYVVASNIQLLNGNDKSFQKMTDILRRRHPNNPYTHFYSGVSHLQKGEWKEAEKSLNKARETGIPEETINQYLKMAIDGQKWIWEYAYIVFMALSVWVVGLVVLYVSGRILSAMTLKSITAYGVEPHGTFSVLHRKLYRLVIFAAGLYYYFSLPMIAILSIVLPLTIGYGLLSLPSFSIFLVGGLLLAGAGGVISALTGIRKMVLKLNVDVSGEMLTEEDEPAFWKIIRDVAQLVGTKPVDEIRIIPGEKISVYESGKMKMFSRIATKRVLFLGVSDIEVLSTDSFKSILAHEYAHFLHGDTAGGYTALRVQYSIDQFNETLSKRKKLPWWDVGFQFLKFYNIFFFRLTLGASRLQEVHADSIAVNSFGKTAFKKGMLQVVRRGNEISIRADKEYKKRLRDTSINLEFMHEQDLLQPLDQEQLENIIKEVLEMPSNEFSTHPSIKERFKLADGIKAVDLYSSKERLKDSFKNLGKIQQETDEVINKFINDEIELVRANYMKTLSGLTAKIRKAPSADLYYDRAVTCYEIGEDENAIKDLTRILNEIPDHAQILYNRAAIYEAMEEYDKALVDLATFLTGVSMDTYISAIQAGEINLKKNSPSHALKLFTLAIECVPTSWSAYVLRGKAHMMLFNTGLADLDFAKANELNPSGKAYIKRYRRQENAVTTV